MSDEMSSDEILNYLDWEIDEGWVKQDGVGYTHLIVDEVAHFKFIPLAVVEEEVMAPRREFPVIIVMAIAAIPFWLLAAYGLYCLVRR